MMNMAARVQYAWILNFSGKPVPDPILFILLMSLLFWLLSVSAGYYLTRYSSPWMTVLPTGLALLAINHFDPWLKAVRALWVSSCSSPCSWSAG